MAKKQENTAGIEKMSFEQALHELETIVAKLESGSVELEVSIDLYERGEKLKNRCDTLLKKATARVEKITLSADGAAKKTEPLDVE